jgi:hypothetical protein
MRFLVFLLLASAVSAAVLFQPSDSNSTTGSILFVTEESNNQPVEL